MVKPKVNPDIVNIIDGSFDASLLIDKRGRVRHMNDQCEALLSIEEGSAHTEVDALMVFVSSPTGEMTGDLCWKDVFQDLSKRPYPAQWHVQCTNQRDNSMFPATVKLAKANWKDGSDYVFAHVRMDEHHKNRMKELHFDQAVDPMMAIDERGTVLMLNQAAVDGIEWCEPDLVGSHITQTFGDAKGFESEVEPILTVEESGTVATVNTAAMEDIAWCTPDLVGKNLLELGSLANGDSESNSSIMGWWSGKKEPKSSSFRKKSPQVLRIFLQQVEDDESNSMTGSASRTLQTGGNSTTDQTKESIMWAIVEASLDPMFQINEKGTIQMVNKAAVRQFGYSREQFLGNNISMIVGGGHAKNHDKYLKRYLETGITKVIGKKRILDARRSDGTEFPIELGVVEVDTFQGDERLFCGFVHDLSSIKKRERLTTDIVEASLDPMFLITESGIVKMVNKAALEQFGYKKEELIGLNISLIVGGGHDRNHDTYLKNYLTTGNTKVIGKLRQLPARRKDGTEFPIQLGVIEMKSSSDEERMFCGFVHNLTEVKSRERIANGIIESSLDSMLQIDDQGTIEMVNQAAVETFGWSREEFMGKNIKMIVPMSHEGSHDNYLKRFRETGKVHLVGKRRELTARKRDGSEFPIEINIAPIEDKYSKKTKFCGFLRDLTDVKQHKGDAVKRENLMRGMINASLDAMFQIDHMGKILTVNNAASRVFGWTEHELLGSNISMICGKEHAANHDNYLKRYLETGEKRAMGKKRQLPARRKDGSEIPIELSLTEVITATGRTFCGFVSDRSQVNQQAEITTGMIDVSLDPMFLIDSRGLIQMVNQAACTHFGWDRDEFLNSNIRMIVGGDHARYHDSYIKSYLETGESGVIGRRRVLPGRRKDGSEFPIELAVVEVKRPSGSYFCGYARVVDESSGQEFY